MGRAQGCHGLNAGVVGRRILPIQRHASRLVEPFLALPIKLREVAGGHERAVAPVAAVERKGLAFVGEVLRVFRLLMFRLLARILQVLTRGEIHTRPRTHKADDAPVDLGFISAFVEKIDKLDVARMDQAQKDELIDDLTKLRSFANKKIKLLNG